MRGTVVQVSRSNGGVPKLPVQEVFVSKRGVAGDNWAHPRYHGGPKQALLLIAAETLDELRQIGFVLSPGDLGENLTVAGLDRRLWRSGQRFQAGEVHLELTKLRQPCNTLKVYGPGIQKQLYDGLCRKSDPGSPVWARGGFYAAVTQPGMLRAGDAIVLDTE